MGYKKEQFYSLNDAHHGKKYEINNGMFEHKTTSAA
jgi:hypothetical protein